MFVSIVLLKKDNKFVTSKSIKINTSNEEFAHLKWNQYLKKYRKEGFDCEGNLLINVDSSEEVTFTEDEFKQFLDIQEKYFK